MAANSKGRQLAGGLGKRFATQIWAGCSRDPAPLPSFPASASRVFSRAYEKEIDDQVRPTVVPDHVIPFGPDGKYWGPHPQTGVFGPAEKSGSAAAGGDSGLRSSPPGSTGDGSSALDQTVWFRPLEDVDKPPYA